MFASIPASLQGQKYISLKTFRKSGVGVATAVWFGEDNGKLYVKTRSDMGKTKRVRNNPRVRVAPCTIRGTVTGAELDATARILPPEEHARAKAGYQPEVLGGEDSVFVVENGHLSGD